MKNKDILEKLRIRISKITERNKILNNKIKDNSKKINGLERLNKPNQFRYLLRYIIDGGYKKVKVMEKRVIRRYPSEIKPDEEYRLSDKLSKLKFWIPQNYFLFWLRYPQTNKYIHRLGYSLLMQTTKKMGSVPNGPYRGDEMDVEIEIMHIFLVRIQKKIKND